MSQWKCNSCGGTYNDLGRDGGVYMHACAPSPPDENGVQKEHPNKRDETIVLGARDMPRDIRAPGAGVTALDGQATSEPEWVLTIRAEYDALPVV